MKKLSVPRKELRITGWNRLDVHQTESSKCSGAIA